VPLKPNTRPSESTARQKDGAGHDTPVSPEASDPESGGSWATDAGAENDEPFQVSAAPALSTAMQNVGVAQDTALSCPWGSASVGCVHVCPFQTEGPPSTATQKVGAAQEIWLAAPQAPTFPDHDVPLNTKEFPSPSIDTQNVVPAQPIDSNPCAAGIVVGPDHDVPLKRTAWFRFGTAAQKVALVQVR
jgi:hypothetical protein